MLIIVFRISNFGNFIKDFRPARELFIYQQTPINNTFLNISICRGKILNQKIKEKKKNTFDNSLKLNNIIRDFIRTQRVDWKEKWKVVCLTLLLCVIIELVIRAERAIGLHLNPHLRTELLQHTSPTATGSVCWTHFKQLSGTVGHTSLNRPRLL